MRETYMHTGRTPSEREGKNGHDVSICQETLRISRRLQKLGEKHGTESPAQLSDGTSHAQIDQDFQAPELGDNIFLVFKPPSLWYSNPSKLIHLNNHTLLSSCQVRDPDYCVWVISSIVQ